MAQIKIYGLVAQLDKNRVAISTAIHSAAVQILKLPEDKKFHRFLGLEKENFIFPVDRSEQYTIIEVRMFAGRTESTIKDFIKQVISNLSPFITPQDVEITVLESPKFAWGIRGITGDELALTYKVDV